MGGRLGLPVADKARELGLELAKIKLVGLLSLLLSANFPFDIALTSSPGLAICVSLNYLHPRSLDASYN